jgi:tetratricopeptide (TPR) repeat protein
MEAGRALKDKGELRNALAELRAAARIDPEHAETRFLLARCLDALGRPEDALPHYEAARDLDTVRWRISSDYNDAVRELARRLHDPGVLLADADAYLRSQAPDGIPGAQLFLEHVHSTLPGNFVIAEGVARALHESAPAALFGEWDWSRHGEFGHYLEMVRVGPLDRILVLELMTRLLADLLPPGGLKELRLQKLRRQAARLESGLAPEQARALATARAAALREPGGYDWLHLFLALEYAESGKTDLALRETASIREFGSWQMTGELYAGVFVTESNLLRKGGRPEDAIEAARHALELDPGRRGAMRALSAAYYAVGDEAAGARWAKRAGRAAAGKP